MLEEEYRGIAVHSTFVSDVNGDGRVEIIAVGDALNGNQSIPQLFTFNWNGKGLALYVSAQCFYKNGGQFSSVYTSDLDGDDDVEIVTADYMGDVKNSSSHFLSKLSFNQA